MASLFERDASIEDKQLDYPDQPREEGVIVTRLFLGLSKRPYTIYSTEA
jgi:hypothetical protein